MKNNGFLKTIMLLQHLDQQSIVQIASTMAALYNIDEKEMRHILTDLNQTTIQQITAEISELEILDLKNSNLKSDDLEKALKSEIIKLKNYLKATKYPITKLYLRTTIIGYKEKLIHLKNLRNSKKDLLKSTPTLVKKIVDFYDYYTKTKLFVNDKFNESSLEIEIVLCWGDYSVEFSLDNDKFIYEVNKSSICIEYRKLTDRTNSDCQSKLINEAIQYTSTNEEIKENYCIPENRNENSIDKMFNYILDPLGLYISDEYNNRERKCKIVLFCDKIVDSSFNKNFDYKALFEVVMAHELAHAYHHLGIDENNHHNKYFYDMTTNVIEGYANYMTDWYIEKALHSPSNKTLKLQNAFLNGTNQSGPYSIYKGFKIREYTVKNINAVNGFYRNEKKRYNTWKCNVSLMKYDGELKTIKQKLDC
jgi:hypothetical protein